MDVFLREGMWLPRPTLTEENLPDQSGKVFIVTGGYSGVGWHLGKILYQRNGVVYIAGRRKDKFEEAVADIKKECPSSTGRLEYLHLDLSDLPTIAKTAQDFMAKEDRLDVLTNNAGVMVPPAGSKTMTGDPH
ncbi:hypothetical protein KEM56_005787 [Ascosphaera pollenicola]|nr:hypothetical protein KEM56_005787 [Ascosphaera pollenicola]